MNELVALLGELTPTEFLQHYWQKRPLLVRGAFPAWQNPLSPAELAGFACDEGVEARLVLERHGTRPWEVRHGPFTDTDFTTLPTSHWTLLVQDMDKHLPDLATLLAPFDFIPSWRFDDLMISYAAPQGSVGPHWDDYDVFLIQGFGRRRWAVGTTAIEPGNRLPDTDLRIMAEFTPEDQWILAPGDMLYLPPRVGHHGVALEPCMTYSVGFRAPAQRDLAIGFLEARLEGLDPGARYSDPDLIPATHAGEIDLAARAQLRRLLRDALAASDAELDRWLGRWLTEPRPGLEPEPPERHLDGQALLDHLRATGELMRRGGTRILWARIEGRPVLFAGGLGYALPDDLIPMATLLSSTSTLTLEDLAPFLENAAAREILIQLCNQGVLGFDDDA